LSLDYHFNNHRKELFSRYLVNDALALELLDREEWLRLHQIYAMFWGFRKTQRE